MIKRHASWGSGGDALNGASVRPRTEEDGPLLHVRLHTRGASRDAAAGAGNGAKAPAVRPVGRPCMGPAMRPAPCPERQVDRPSASTHVQAPPAELQRLLVLVQLSTTHLTLLLFLAITSIPAIKAAVQAREAAFAARLQSSRFGCAWK
eukprot:1161001-Pelagomonas_calceolata.AAC.6